jgi:UDP-N-acetylmuramoylalanine--D-glutamate ligase
MRSRPAISWSDLRGARVGIWGLGVEGRAARERLVAAGAELVVVDDRPAAGTGDVVALAAGGLDLLERCEVVVKAPGVSRYRHEVEQLEARGVVVTGGLALWLAEADRERVLCVTGTKGKSTTVAIAGHVLRALGHDVFVGGNLGAPPFAPGVPPAEWWVIETSSFQAADVAVSPPVVGVTSLHPDHLDWHGSVERYYADKLSLTNRPGAALTLADGTSDELRAGSGALGPRVEWVLPDESLTIPAGVLPGPHNRRNVAMARACLVALGIGIAGDRDAFTDALSTFEGLDHRLRVIGAIGGVEFVDDSLATNPLPTIAALDAYPQRRVALLVGGFDRGVDYAPLARAIAARDAPVLVCALPGSGERVLAAVEQERPGREVESARAPDLGAAVRVALGWAAPDGVVLLSPAAPSFGQYRDYRERSVAFARALDDCRRRAAEGGAGR